MSSKRIVHLAMVHSAFRDATGWHCGDCRSKARMLEGREVWGVGFVECVNPECLRGDLVDISDNTTEVN